MSEKTEQRASDRRQVPAYPLAEAARYVRLPVATLRSWCLGRDYQRRDGTRRFHPLLRLPEPRKRLLSFENLIEAHVLRALRTEHAVAIRQVRQAIVYAQGELSVERLLLSRTLSTMQGELFLERYGQLINLSRSGQLAMKKVLEDHLKRVEWDAAEFPIRLYPFVRAETGDAPRTIVIDPAIAFGRPVIRKTGVSTRAIRDRIDAGELPHIVAEDYDLEPGDIEEAVLYERVA